MVVSGQATAVAAEKAIAATAKELEKYCGKSRLSFASKAVGGNDELERDLALVTELYHFAEIMDETAFLAILDREIGARGVERVWSNILVPLLTKVGLNWEEFGNGIAIEHFVSEAISISLRRATKDVLDPINERPIFIACVEGDYHTLPLKALIAALSAKNIRAVSLGGQLPSENLAEAISKVAPPVIFLWAQMKQSKKQMQKVLGSLPNFRTKPLVVIGGPGWVDYEAAGFKFDKNLRHSGSIAQTVTYISEVFLGG
jgi:hypothetical protein